VPSFIKSWSRWGANPQSLFSPIMSKSVASYIRWSRELNRCGFLLPCQEQNTTSNKRSDVSCTDTPFRIIQFNPLRVLYYWVMKSFMIHDTFMIHLRFLFLRCAFEPAISFVFSFYFHFTYSSAGPKQLLPAKLPLQSKL
jgi:hypothetical protein